MNKFIILLLVIICMVLFLINYKNINNKQIFSWNEVRNKMALDCKKDLLTTVKTDMPSYLDILRIYDSESLNNKSLNGQVSVIISPVSPDESTYEESKEICWVVYKGGSRGVGVAVYKTESGQFNQYLLNNFPISKKPKTL